MPAYLLLALSFAIGRALVTIYQKYLAEYLEHDWKVFTFIFYFSSLIMAGVFYLISPWTFSIEVTKAVLPASIPFFLGGACLYYALFDSDVSIIGGLQTLKLVPLVFLTNIMLGESFSPLVYFLIGFLILSSLFVVIDEDVEISDFINRAILLSILSSIFFAFSDVMIKKSFSVLPPISFMSANLFLAGYFLYCCSPLLSRNYKKLRLKR